MKLAAAQSLLISLSLMILLSVPALSGQKEPSAPTQEKLQQYNLMLEEALVAIKRIEDQHQRRIRYELLFETWALVDHERALQELEPVIREGFSRSNFVNFYRHFAKQSPGKAIESARAIEDRYAREFILAHIMNVITPDDTQLALALMQEIQELKRNDKGRFFTPHWDIFQQEVVEEIAKTNHIQALELAQPLIEEDFSFRGRLAAKLILSDVPSALGLLRAMKDPRARNHALECAIRALAAKDPYRAEEVAWSLSGNLWRGWALGVVAEEMAKKDLPRALKLARSLENVEYVGDRILRSVNHRSSWPDPEEAIDAARKSRDEHRIVRAIQSAVREIAENDPTRALELAHSIKDKRAREDALLSISIALSKTDTLAALEIALALMYPEPRHMALQAVLPHLAESHPDRTVEVILQWGASDVVPRDEVLKCTIPNLAKSLPKQTLELVKLLTSPDDRVSTFASLAKRWKAKFPQLSERATRLAFDTIYSSGSEDRRPFLLYQMSRRIGIPDLDAGMEIAQQIESSGIRDKALERMALALSFEDLEKAGRVALEISDPSLRAKTLTSIVYRSMRPDSWRAFETYLSVNELLR